MTVEVRGDRGGEVVQSVALQAAGLVQGEEPLNDSVASVGLGAVACPPPVDRMPEGARMRYLWLGRPRRPRHEAAGLSLLPAE